MNIKCDEDIFHIDVIQYYNNNIDININMNINIEFTTVHIL